MDSRSLALKAGVGGAVMAGIAFKRYYDRRLFLLDNIVLLLARSRTSALLTAKTEEDVIASGARATTGPGKKLGSVATGLGYSMETVQVPVEGGQISIHVFSPRGRGRDSGAPLPMIVWFHGGGMCIGSAMDSPALHSPGFHVLEHFQGQAIVLSVDYRMAPKYKFPIGAQDAIAATRWIHDNASQFNGDNERMCVAGPSAGGYLSAIVHQAARDQGFGLRCALLFEPMGRRGATTASYLENGRDLGLTTEMMLWFWTMYCPDAADAANPLCEPIRGIGEGNLAPCIVTTSQYDPLRDEGIEYFEALKKANVPVEHISFQSSHIAHPIDREALRKVLCWWSKALGLPEGLSKL